MANNLKAMLSTIKARMNLRRGSKTSENSESMFQVLSYSMSILFYFILETTSPHKLIGLNTLLVSECVAYLKQPRSLREEGLFRIPGELNQVNMYLKQFDYCELLIRTFLLRNVLSNIF